MEKKKYEKKEKKCVPRRGIEPRPWRWERQILTTRPPGKAEISAKLNKFRSLHEQIPPTRIQR